MLVFIHIIDVIREEDDDDDFLLHYYLEDYYERTCSPWTMQVKPDIWPLKI